MYEKCYKSIIGQYYIANCVSWVSMLTLLDLWTRFWNGTHSSCGWLTVLILYVGKLRPKEKWSADLISVDPEPEVFSHLQYAIWEWQSCRSPAGPAPSGGVQFLLLGTKSSTHAEAQPQPNGKGRVLVQQGLYASNCPLVPHQCPLLPTPGLELTESWGEKVVTKNKTTNIYWAFYIHFLSPHHQSLFYRWGNWYRLKDVKQPVPI